MKKVIPIICMVLASCAIVAAIGLIFFATDQINNDPNAIKIESVELFTVRYCPDPEKDDFYSIQADINEGEITVKHFTEIEGNEPVSTTDTASSTDTSATNMQEERRTFRTDLSELEEYIIEHSEDFLVDDYEYNLNAFDGHKVICDMTLVVNGSKYLHMEWLTKLPDNWSAFIDEIQRVSGFSMFQSSDY